MSTILRHSFPISKSGIIDRYEQQFYIGSQDRTVGFKGIKRVGKTTITKREETGEPDGQKMGNL